MNTIENLADADGRTGAVAYLQNIKIGFIGVGNIGEAVIGGLLRNGLVQPNQIAGSVAREESIARVRSRLGIATCVDNRLVASESDIVILAVKWDVIDCVMQEIALVLTAKKLVISLAGAMTAEYIEDRMNGPVPVVLAIPNSPCSVNAGLTLLCAGTHAQAEHLQIAEALFKCLGESVVVDARLLDSFIALSSSGPAFFYLIAEALAQAGLSMGIPAAEAKRVVAQTMLGASQMLLQRDEHPALLREAITTPGGCTIAGINELEQSNVRGAMISAATATTKRLGELRRTLGT